MDAFDTLINVLKAEVVANLEISVTVNTLCNKMSLNIFLLRKLKVVKFCGILRDLLLQNLLCSHSSIFFIENYVLNVGRL